MKQSLQFEDYIHISSKKFPVTEDEKKEIVNEGMYGKKFCQYLKEGLTNRGYIVQQFFPEDWGWLIQISSEIPLGLCIYCAGDTSCYSVTHSLLQPKKISFRQLCIVDYQLLAVELMQDVEVILRSDPDITITAIVNAPHLEDAL